MDANQERNRIMVRIVMATAILINVVCFADPITKLVG